MLAPFVTPGSLVVLESTTYPGTTETLVVPTARGWLRPSRRSGLLRRLQPGADRPRQRRPGPSRAPRRSCPASTRGRWRATEAFYRHDRRDDRARCPSTRSAELAKLLENTFRHVNIALVNELAMVAADLDIDVWEAIDAAATKPFGFMRFTPGPGVGGHCLPIDPSYLSWTVRQRLGRSFRFVELANDINDHMPDYVVSRVVRALNKQGRAMSRARVLVLGLAYKRNSSDARESPAVALVEQPGPRRRRGRRRRPARGRGRCPVTPTSAGSSCTRPRSSGPTPSCWSLITTPSTTTWCTDHARYVLDTRHRLEGAHVEHSECPHDERPELHSASRISVVLSGWPRVSEVFALNELIALHRRGMLGGGLRAQAWRGRAAPPGRPRGSIPGRGAARRRRAGQGDAGRQAVRRDRRWRRCTATSPTSRPRSRRRPPTGCGVPYGFSAHALDARKVRGRPRASGPRGAPWSWPATATRPLRSTAVGAAPRLVRHGVDLAAFPATAATRRTPVQLLAVGRHGREEGLRRAARCARAGRRPGTAADRRRRRAPAADRRRDLDARADDRVELLGRLNARELPAAYAGADIVVVPSSWTARGTAKGCPTSCSRPWPAAGR